MEETKQLSEKEQLIESALEKVLQGGDTNLKLAIWDLEKAKDVHAGWINGHSREHYLNTKCDILKRLIEILTGIDKSKESLICQLLEGAHVKLKGSIDSIRLHDIENVYIGGFLKDLLKNHLSEMWLKSLKYDAIIKALESQDSDEQKDKDTLFKVLGIIGKS